jgi:hypothetical protein
MDKACNVKSNQKPSETTNPRRARRPLRRRGLGLENLEARLALTDVSGAIAANTTWTKAASPYNVTGDVTVQSAATLNIEPGVVVNFAASTGITINGRLVAEGTAFDRISMRRASAGGNDWDGLSFSNTLTDSRITFTDFTEGDGQGESIHVVHARLTVDNVTWTGTTGTAIEMEHPSVVIRNSVLPKTSGSEVLHGEYITGDEYLIIENNVFLDSQNGGAANDVVDILGADRPGPVMQILNNVFMGGGDDGLDLDGTDAHVEGNIFMNFHRTTSRATTSNAIATGLPQTGETNRTQVTVVRNIFVNNDHHILIKEDAFATIENNVFLNATFAAIQFNEIGGTEVLGPGMGAEIDGNIFKGNASLFKNLTKTASFETILEVKNSLLPDDVQTYSDGSTRTAHSYGDNNIAGDPLFVDEAGGNYRLQPNSPAKGTGPLGLDMGAYVPQGPVISGAPTSPSPHNDQVLTVGGPGMVDYRYRVDGGPYGAITPVSEPIVLTDLANGDHTVEVMGRDDAGEWFQGQMPAFLENHAEVIAPTRTRTGEALPMIVRVRGSNGDVNTLLTTPATLNNAAQLSSASFKVKKGVGSQSPTVTAASDFSITFGGSLATGSTGRAIDVLDAGYPVQTHSGTLSGNTVWDNTAEHRITGNLTIPAGSTLTIMPGTRVMLGDKVNVFVDGAIATQGTAADPVAFNAISPAQPWGGIEVRGAAATGDFAYTFITQGGADTTRNYGHSNSQPVLKADGSTVTCGNCYIINNTGKALGSRSNARLTFDSGVISNNDTGGQLDNTVVTITNTWIKDMPNDNATFVDDDNDGIYLLGTHSSGEYSLVKNDYIIDTQDDCIDHNGAKVNIVSDWLQGCTHEGVASSDSNFANVIDTVVIGTNQGFEAGYGGPNLSIDHSVATRINKKLDPDPNTAVNAGIRFGDVYNGSNGAYTGHITATNNVLFDSQDNVRNYDGSIPGPKAGAIDITYSMTNDADYNSAAGNFTGTPVFGQYMHLLRGSAGFFAGSDGETVGRIFPSVSTTFTIDSNGPLPRISEVLANNVAAVNVGGAFPELIELVNDGNVAADLSGWGVSDDAAAPGKFVLPAETVIAPGERLVLQANSGSGGGAIHVGFGLSGAGGAVYLSEPGEAGFTETDSVVFGRQIADRSIAVGLDGAWRLATPTLGAANTTLPTASPSGVKLNEWLAAPNAAFPTDFIELFNPAAQPVDIGGLHLTNNAATPGLFTIRPLSFVPAGGLALFYASGDANLGFDNTNFQLAPAGGVIALTAVNPAATIDTITYAAQTAGRSQGRTPNGSATINTINPPTPGANNPTPPPPTTVTVNLQDGLNGYTGTRDAWLEQSSANANHGNETPINVDSRRTDSDANTAAWGLLKFDVSSIPADKIINSAVVTIDVTNASTGGTYELYESLRNWDEATATWNVFSTGNPWQPAGGVGANDRGTTILGSLGSSSATGLRTITLNAAGLALVESWGDNPASNHGFVFYNAANLDGIQFRSSEYNTDTTRRPKLTIEYSNPVDPAPQVTAGFIHLETAQQNVQFQFSEEVLIDAADLTLTNTDTSEVVPSDHLAMTYNSQTNTATFTYPGFTNGVLPSGTYTAELDLLGVTDLQGNPLESNGSEKLLFTWLRGDVDTNLSLTAADIDALYASFSPSQTDPRFDLDGDGNVDQQDVDVLVTSILGTNYGDANLDHVVNRADAAIVAAHFGGAGGWASGNFDGAADIALADLALLQQQLSPAASPEAPAAVVATASRLRAVRAAHRVDSSHAIASATDVALSDLTSPLGARRAESRRSLRER